MAVIPQFHPALIRTSLALLAAWPALLRAEDAPVELPAVSVIGEQTELQDSGVVIRVPVQPLGASDLGELLASLPGVQVRSSGGLGSYSEASLRGSTGRQVRVLLDGLPLDTGGGDASSLSLISPLLLEAVDVYKGRVPAALGSGLAGTINLRSRRELAAPIVGSATTGSFGQRQLDVAGQLGDSMQLVLGGQAADNDFRILNPFKPFDPEDPERKDTEKRRNAATSQHYGLFRYRGPIELTAHVVEDQQELPTRDNSATADAEFDTRSYALSLANSEISIWQYALSHRLTRENYRDPASQIGLGAQDTQSDTHRTLASVGRRFERVQDTFSVEYTDYQAEDKLGTAQTRSADRISVSNSIGAQIGDDTKYNASLQTGWWRDEADGDRDDRWQFEPAIGTNRQIGSCMAAANLGRRRRLPTFFERYGDRGFFRGNPALKPETANYADIGSRCVPDFKQLQRLELTVFGQDIYDAINPTYSAQGVGRSVNADRGLIYGLELDAGGALAGFGWQINGTWQQTEDRSNVAAARGQQLPGRFQTQINTRIEHRIRNIILHYAYRLEAGQYYDTANNLKMPEMQRHDIGARGAIAKLGWSVQALNLGDDHYEQFNGYPTPGRRLLLSLNYPNQDGMSPVLPAAETVSESTTRGARE